MLLPEVPMALRFLDALQRVEVRSVAELRD
jgi:hypothetical protein